MKRCTVRTRAGERPRKSTNEERNTMAILGVCMTTASPDELYDPNKDSVEARKSTDKYKILVGVFDGESAYDAHKHHRKFSPASYNEARKYADALALEYGCGVYDPFKRNQIP